MKMVLGWVGVLFASVGLGLVLYDQVVQTPSGQLPAAAQSVGADPTTAARPTVVVTETKRLKEPGPTVTIDVPVTVPEDAPADAGRVDSEQSEPQPVVADSSRATKSSAAVSPPTGARDGQERPRATDEDDDESERSDDRERDDDEEKAEAPERSPSPQPSESRETEDRE